MSTADIALNGYRDVQHRRDRVVEAIDILVRVTGSLQMHERVEGLEILRERVCSDAFKVIVLGEFKRGKSIMINALLGEKVLPSHSKPTTATINEVKWGEQPYAVLHPRPASGVRQEPREIPIEQLGDHVRVVDDSEINPYERVEVFYPLALCRDGVVIIDSPGLNDVATREQVTISYLQDVDAVLMVFAADMLGSMSEIAAIDEMLIPLGHDHIFLVVNRINLIDPEERDEVIEHGTLRLASKSKLNDVFFVDAKGALQARMAKDAQAFSATGFPELERALERFLTHDRGKLKMLAPATELLHVLDELKVREIPDREAMLTQTLGELEQRAHDAQEPLDGLDDKRDLILAQLDSSLDALSLDVASAARVFFEEAAVQLPEWAKEFQSDKELKFLGSNKDIKEALGQEISEHLARRLGSAFAQWRQETLRPMLEERLGAIANATDTGVKDFLGQADLVRVEVVGSDEQREESFGFRQVDHTALERVLATGGALSLSGPSAGAKMSLGGPSMAMGMAGAVVLSHGVLLIPAALARIFGMDKAKRKVQQKAAKSAAGELRELVAERSDEVANAALAQPRALREKLAIGLESELRRVHEQIDSVLAAKRSGEDGVAEQRGRLAEARGEIDQAQKLVTDLLFELAAM